MKKKLMIVLVGFVIFAGGTQVYASSVLNTNIVNLIRVGFSNIGSFYQDEAKKEAEQVHKDSVEGISKFVDDKSTEVINDIEGLKEDEIDRMRTELDKYEEEIREEVEGISKMEFEKIRKKFEIETDSNIEEAKIEMERVIQQKLQRKIRE